MAACQDRTEGRSAAPDRRLAVAATWLPPSLTHRGTFRRATDSIPQPPPEGPSQFANGIVKGPKSSQKIGRAIFRDQRHNGTLFLLCANTQ